MRWAPGCRSSVELCTPWSLWWASEILWPDPTGLFLCSHMSLRQLMGHCEIQEAELDGPLAWSNKAVLMSFFAINAWIVTTRSTFASVNSWDIPLGGFIISAFHAIHANIHLIYLIQYWMCYGAFKHPCQTYQIFGLTMHFGYLKQKE